MKEIVIIGAGPAGISAALYTLRANIPTTIIAQSTGALEKAEKIENYYGLAAPLSGSALAALGIKQAKALGARFVKEQVVSLGYTNRFTVKTPTETYEADSVILATGAPRQQGGIPDIDEYEGKGVSYCAICDGFFHRDKPVCVVGCCDYAISEAGELMGLAKSVTLLTNGQPLKGTPPDALPVLTEKIAGLRGKDALEEVVLEDGKTLPLSGLFVALGTADSGALAAKIGAACKGNVIEVDKNMATNIPGLFAAGDCTGGLLQIAKAVHEGAAAGMAAVKFCKK